MPNFSNPGSTTRSSSKQPFGRVNKYWGTFVGIVKDNQDGARTGRLRIWVPDFGSRPEDESSWITAIYCSPFAGVTPSNLTKPGVESFDNTQTSYGMWMVPPDVENQVALTFIGGDPGKAMWFGCLYENFLNQMVPGIAASDKNYEYPGKPLPVSEYNKNTVEKVDINNITRPAVKEYASSISKQGLINDNIRGLNTSSSRRESPSQVYGFLTPGPKNPNSAGNRMGGHQIVFDDGEGNEYIGFKTRGGVSIRIDETNDLIYMINKSGTGWLQIDSDGNVDIFGAGSISMRAMEDINLRADRNVNIESGQNINLKACKDYSGSDTIMTPFTGYGGNINIEANNDLSLLSWRDSKFDIRRNLDLVTGANFSSEIKGTQFNKVLGDNFSTTVGLVSVKSTGELYIESTANANIKTSGTMRYSGSNASLNDEGVYFGEDFQTPTIGIVGHAHPRTSTGSGGGGSKTDATSAIAPTIPEAVISTTIEITLKRNMLESFKDFFTRNSQNVQSIVSRFMTYEPCPEHTKKGGTPVFAKYTWYKDKTKLKDKPQFKDTPLQAPPPPPEPYVPADPVPGECLWKTPAAGMAWEPIFLSATQEYNLPCGLISRVAYQESHYNPKALNKGSNAQGMMQIVPRWHPGVDPWNPDEAIPYAAKYIRQLYNQFGSWDKALAAYNWGLGNLGVAIKKYGDDWLTHTPTETYNYVTQIGKDSGVLTLGNDANSAIV